MKSGHITAYKHMACLSLSWTRVGLSTLGYHRKWRCLMAADGDQDELYTKKGSSPNYFSLREIKQFIHALMGSILGLRHYKKKKNIDQAKHYTLDL